MFTYLSIDKTIKLWKFGPKRKYVCSSAEDFHSTGVISLPTPAVHSHIEAIQPSLKRTYANAHAYHINSLALNSDDETFISADDLRINIWRLDSNLTTFSKFSI